MNSEITALKETIYDLEQRLEIALLNANQVWWEWDIPSGALKTHAIKDCILGYDLGKIRHHLDFWMDALPPEERTPVWESLQEHLSGKNEMWSMEHQYRDPQGEYKWVLEAGKVVKRSQDGSPLRMVGITQNIHDKKLRDEELKIKNAKLTEALKLKDIVLATTSHDVINALNSGMGMAGLLAEETIGHTKEFKLIEQSLSNSVKLISSIHELAKGNLVEVEKHLIDPISIVHETREFHEPAAATKGLEFRVEAKESDTIMTDRFALRRILDNLVGNAIKFTSSGFVMISEHSTDADLILEVSDSGSGIPADKENQLFEPFKKFSSESAGSGLGLSICQDLAKRLSGSISYRANSPTGSIFRVTIPRTGLTGKSQPGRP